MCVCSVDCTRTPRTSFLTHRFTKEGMSSRIDKETKYDRQLRLWAQDGQSRLEKGHICLINVNPTGVETLKNLILPGIGTYTIVDDRIVEQNDLDGNFFLTEDDLGKSIAESVAKSLSELNLDVQWFSHSRIIGDLLHEPHFFDSFDVVLISDFIPPSDMLAMKQRLWSKGVPLFHVNTCGFYGTLQVFSEENAVIETHDPSTIYDLRIDRPWPELQTYADSIDLESLDDTEHAHVPYIVIFIKALQRWKRDHDSSTPKNYKEKREFRSRYIEGLSRNINLETNFIEAGQQVHRALQVTAIPEHLKELFHDMRASDPSISGKTALFWLFIRTLAKFAEKYGALPLPGRLPDMASNTRNYIAIQQIYRKKALEDQQRFANLLQQTFSEFNRTEIVSLEMIAIFCKNAASIYYSRGSQDAFSDRLKNEMILCQSESNTLAIHYGIHALHLWIAEGSHGGFTELLKSFSRVLGSKEMDVIPENCKSILKEIYEHQTNKYHNICSLLGGVASQEILKVVTAQYIPLNNLFVFDGIRSVSEKWKP